ncbi:MAG: metal-dependent hydrolase [Planctomycetota bacterium]|nr:MAG: metal-dependent hydrolase [Planctomycetota bacterium]
MRYLDPHAHMVSRTTDDYRAMALAGCVAVTEPAFWAGWDRSSASGFADYFRQLTEFEPTRAARFGIDHSCWLCLNPKEGHDRGLAREVLAILPEFLDRPTVLGVGEIGLNKNTRNELATFEDHVALALDRGELILIHTPHLEDKLKGTRLIIDALRHAGADPDRVWIDHAEEHTLGLIRDAGFWAGLTLYPTTKASPARAADMIETFGADRLIVSSACDWGDAAPTGVPTLALELRQRGHAESLIRRIVFENPCDFLEQCPKFRRPARG